MIKIPCKHKLKWDYKGAGILSPKNPYTQKDWNQTLSTMINKSSAIIHRNSLCGGADTIRMNCKMFQILNTLEYYNLNGDGELNNYHVIIDNMIYDDVIYVYNSKIIEDPNYNLVPKFKRRIENEIGEVSFVYGTKKEIKKYKRDLIIKLKISNYKPYEN